MEIVYVVFTIVRDAYWMMLCMILIVLQTEISFIEHCLKSGDGTEFQLLTKALMDIATLMGLFAKCFVTPIMFGLMCLFFNGTLQLFQFFILIESAVTGLNIVEVLHYIMWFLPFAIKLSAMINLATITSNKVSARRYCNFSIMLEKSIDG